MAAASSLPLCIADPNLAAEGLTPLLAAVVSDQPDIVEVRRTGGPPVQSAAAGQLCGVGLQTQPFILPTLALGVNHSISVPARGPIPPQQLLNFGAGPNTEGAGGELPLVESIQAMPANPAIVEVGACCTSVARMLAAASATHKSRRSEACRAGQGHV